MKVYTFAIKGQKVSTFGYKKRCEVNREAV